jgi:hypothetical protein
MKGAGDVLDLAALGLQWAGDYEISEDGGQWRALREGAAPEDVLSAQTADELDVAIRADYAARSRP